MRNNNPRNFYNLSAKQVVIGLFLQDEDFRSSVIGYILENNHIDELEEPLHTAFRNVIENPEGVDLAIPLINILTSVFTKEGSFFYILRRLIQILNRNGIQRINRDDVNRYLEVYETTMEEVGQFRHMNLPISIYREILNQLNDGSSPEERFVFSILAGNNPNEMQLPQNELRALFLQDKSFRYSIVSYILEDSDIKELERPLHAAFGNIIRNPEGIDLAISTINTLEHIFIQKESVFRILEQVVRILNRRYRKQRVNRDNVNRYLEVYETTMEEVGQFRYMNLPISMYGNILRELNDNSSAEEKLIFGILAGNDPNKMKMQLSRNELSVLFEIDRMESTHNEVLIMLKTPRLINVLITTAMPESQDRLFAQISNLLTFMGNQNLIDIRSNAIGGNNAPNIWLRYVIFRSAIDRGLNDFVDRFMENELRLLAENKYFAFTQAIEEGRVDILDRIWNFLPSNARDSAFTAAVNGKAAFVRATAHKEPIILDWLWNHASSNEMRGEMLRVEGYFIFDWAVSYGNVKVLKWLWDHVSSREEQHDVMNIGMGNKRFYIIGIACETQNIENMVWVLDRAFEVLTPNEIAEAFSKMSASDVGLFFKTKFEKAMSSDDIAELNSLREKAGLLRMNVQHKESGAKGGINALKYLWEEAESLYTRRTKLGADNYRAFVEAAKNNHTDILDCLWEEAESLGMQREMLGANNYRAFIEAAKNDHVDILDYLWEEAEVLNMQRTMLWAGNSEAFVVAAEHGHIGIVSFLWEKAKPLDMQRAILWADNYRAFLVAASNGHIKIVRFLLEKAKSLGIQRAMLGADSYMAFVEAAQNKHTDILDYLWKEAKSLGMQHTMLGAGNYMAFVEAAENNYVGILDYLWEKAESLDMQRAMLEADGYKVFITAIQENNTDALNYLWERAESLDMQHAMLGASGYKAFIVAAQRDSINALARLWEKAESLNMQCAMLEADGYGAFRAAAQKGHTGVLKFLWEKTESLPDVQNVQRAMLKANDYEALAHIIRNPVDVSLLKEFKLFINKESIINSLKKITVQEWERCLKTIANSGDEKVLDWVWENLISLNIRQEIDKFYQKVRQRVVKAKEPQPGPSSEYEPLPKRPRIESGEEEEHITGETSGVRGTHLHKRKVDNSSEPQPGPSSDGSPPKRLKGKEQYITGETSSIQGTHLDDATITHQPKTRSPGP